MIGWEIDWVGATKRVAPGLGPTGRAGGPLVHPLFLSPIIIPWPPDVMRTQTSLNGSFSAAQSAEKAARFCDECYRSITFSQERKLACERACAFESLPGHGAPRRYTRVPHASHIPHEHDRSPVPAGVG